jgi:hypothetical protein
VMGIHTARLQPCLTFLCFGLWLPLRFGVYIAKRVRL